jgi:epoxide hydrolase-like predicted phosphatase
MASEPDGDQRRYTGLLIDYGGVLTSSLFDAFNAFCRHEGLEADAIFTRFRGDSVARDLLIGLETGDIPEGDFERQFAEMLGVQGSGLIDRLFDGARPEESMLEAVLRARQAGIRTGLISNSWGTSRYDYDKLAELFDGIVISGNEGMRKPAPEMYTLGAERIGLAPEACVYVDDLPFNLTPATELGMATVHHVSSEQTIAELERRFGVPLR